MVFINLPWADSDLSISHGIFAVLQLLMITPFLAGSISGHRRGKARSLEAESLKTITSMVNRSVDLNTILYAALDMVLDPLGMDAGLFRLRTKQEDFPYLIHRGFARQITSILETTSDENLGPYYRLASSVAGDISSWGDSSFSTALLQEGLRFYANYPIRSGNRILGSMVLAAATSKKIEREQEEFLQAICEIIGLAIINAQLREQSEKLAEDLVALQELNKIISRGFNLEEIIRRIVVEGKRLAKTDHCHLFLLDDTQQYLVGSASTQTENPDIRSVKIQISEGSTAVAALMERRVFAVEDISEEETSRNLWMKSLGWRAAIFAPLVTKEHTIGVLVCSDDFHERNFSDQEMQRAETLAHQAAIALENARLFQVISRSQKEWETTFDAMQDCVSVHDTTGKVIRANIALAKRLTTIPQKVIGRHCSDIYNPAGKGGEPCRHLQALKSEPLIVEEATLPSMEGVFQLSVSPWYDKDGRLVGSIHVAKDISNEKLLQQQLIQSEKLSAIGELISGIAHELNNPLTGVMGYAELLQLRQDLDQHAKDNLCKINELALRCQRIVQKLLSFARKQKPERTLSDINEILEKTVDLRSYELQVNNIDINFELDRDLPQTVADAHQLQQVFLNLITNAEQAMLESHGKGCLTIRTHTDAQKAHIMVEITDDGPGIPENHLTRIFDPFFTTKEVGKGTGLGLSLSYGIIKEHGGNIYARSRLGEGATFVIELPVITELQKEISAGPPKSSEAQLFDNLVRGKRILVVDDEKYILDFLAEVFRGMQMKIDTADNGRTAMNKMSDADYDLVVTDFKMPQMSGRELFDWIKENRPQLTNRVVFVTGDTVSIETRSFFEENRTLFLAKPFKIEEVKEVIRKALEPSGSPVSS